MVMVSTERDRMNRQYHRLRFREPTVIDRALISLSTASSGLGPESMAKSPVPAVPKHRPDPESDVMFVRSLTARVHWDRASVLGTLQIDPSRRDHLAPSPVAPVEEEENPEFESAEDEPESPTAADCEDKNWEEMAVPAPFSSSPSTTSDREDKDIDFKISSRTAGWNSLFLCLFRPRITKRNRSVRLRVAGAFMRS